MLADIEIPVRSRVGWDGGEVELMELLRVLLVAEGWAEGTTEPTEEIAELAEEATEVEEGTAELPVTEGTADLEKLTATELKEELLADWVIPTEPMELAEVAEAAMLLDLNDAESGLLLHFALTAKAAARTETTNCRSRAIFRSRPTSTPGSTNDCERGGWKEWQHTARCWARNKNNHRGRSHVEIGDTSKALPPLKRTDAKVTLASYPR